MAVNKHTRAWFINRIGKEVVKTEVNLFEQPIKIASKPHALALYVAQIEKGFKYSEIN